MIEITTLLLGLIVGPQVVGFAAAPQVASVVFEVDGRVAAGVRPEEGVWAARIDLGEELMPHRVDAVAYDADGREIGRDVEWVNLPRPEIAARLVLHGDAWTPDRASLVWEHLAARPVTVRRATATLDGRTLAIPDPADFPLPRPDPDVPHVLALEVTFSNGERIELARAWGGGAIDEIETRLLPFRVATRGDAQWPADPVATLAACLAAPEGAQVAGWEDEGAEVLVVRDLAALPRIDRMVRLSQKRLAQSSRLLPLRDGDRLRQVWPFARRTEHRRGELSLFPSSEATASTERGMISVLRERSVRPRGAEQRLADAVAVAGLLAYGSGRPAAVVLVLADGAEDASAASPPEVRAYLDALGVPLYPWSVGGGGLVGDWGLVDDVSDLVRFEHAVARLRGELDRQRLVWLSGVELPQDVRFGDCACCQPAV
ncbi:MAG TPA: hypothetical protein VM617_00420 [Thermoanaerobaculia bacterium]|nr:hypothetical protein [Thermoanaerobaculia bacterium]